MGQKNKTCHFHFFSKKSFDIQFVPISSNLWEKSDKNISWKIVHFWTFKNFLKIKGWVWGARTPIFRTYSTSSLIWLLNIFSKKNENGKSYFLPHILSYDCNKLFQNRSISGPQMILWTLVSIMLFAKCILFSLIKF